MSDVTNADLRAALERVVSRCREVLNRELLSAMEADHQGNIAFSKQEITSLDQLDAALRRHMDAEAKPVAWLTVYAESNAITARIHDVAHSLPPGTYDLHTAEPLRAGVTDETQEKYT